MEERRSFMSAAASAVLLWIVMGISSCGNLMNDMMSEIEAGRAEANAEKFTLSFDPNGGAGTMAAVIGTGEETVTLPANGFTREGYVFYVWSTSPGGVITL